MFALAGLFALALAARAGDGCREACLAHVTDSRLRAVVCGRCFTDADRGSWAAALADHPQVTGPTLEGLLKDPDWAVRWGGVRAIAKRRAVTEGHALTDWVASAPDQACSTAVHVAGSKKQTTAAVLQPAAAALCWERRAALTKELEIEMYSEAVTVRLESVAHLAAFLERPMTRVVLDAMKSRPPETDDLSAGLLVEASHLGGPPAGKALLDVKKGPGDEALVNRLLAIWSKRIDAVRPLLGAEDKGGRREAIRQLAELAPLSAPELEAALDDVDPTNRRAAATGLAKGEGETLAAYAHRKLDPTVAAPQAARLKWIVATGSSQDPACAETLRAAYRDERHDEVVRAAALAALSDCAGVKAFDTLTEAQSSKVAAFRAGAVRALVNLPREPKTARNLETAFKDPDPGVLAAAAHAAGVLRQHQLTAQVVALLESASAEARREAIGALAIFETKAAVPKIARLLAEDASAPVREAAAQALGVLGTSGAVPALIAASQNDPDAKVKFVAGESLRKLGFKRSSGSMSP